MGVRGLDISPNIGAIGGSRGNGGDIGGILGDMGLQRGRSTYGGDIGCYGVILGWEEIENMGL